MPTQTQSGKAFEYSLANSLYNKLNNGQNIELINNSSFDIAKNCYNEFNENTQNNYDLAANEAIEHLVNLEPRLEHPISDNDRISIRIQSDQEGMRGDIRDVITVRSTHNWEIGFSAKSNHTAVKHSRLSDRIDFGERWFGIPCSEEYMESTQQIFGELRAQIDNARQRGIVLKWSDLGNGMTHEYYRRVLRVFEREIRRLVNSNTNTPSWLLRYLLGQHDFYKIMRFSNYVKIQGFNLDGTLNQPSNSIRPFYRIPRLRLPSNISRVFTDGDNKLIVEFDRGWQLSFRIHNASSRVEPSLKFDIQLAGVPPNLYSNDIILQK